MGGVKLQPAYQKCQRSSSQRIVAGVASGLAQHLGVRVDYVRIAFVLLSFLNGLGLMLYAGVWWATKAEPSNAKTTGAEPSKPEEKREGQQWYWLLVFVALAGAAVSSSLLGYVSAGSGIALGVIALGAFLAWRAYDRFDARRSVAIVLLGALLVLTGVLLAALEWENQQIFGSAVAAVLLTLAGVAALVVPFALRVWDQFSTQREEKLLADERAAIANHLHDSVLQTLALIQKRAEDPEEVRRLARGQERELRTWLFESVEEDTVFSAINRACGEVEDMFGVHIAPVTVGEDAPLDATTQAAVLAAREAMVNAAKHAGVESVDVYAECFDELSIFVRDRGPGFDLDAVPADRHGVRDSIIGRVEKAGGTVNFRIDGGTEVEITVPRAQ